VFLFTSARPLHTFTSVRDVRAAVHIYSIQHEAMTCPANPICPLSLVGWWTTVTAIIENKGLIAFMTSDQMIQNEAREKKPPRNIRK
jgi:hypothetical protein